MIAGDNPIRRFDEDTLGRGIAARSLAQQTLAVDASEGVVVGVLGAWGSGKTSYINLARDEFEKAGVPLLDFNPWMFSGAQQLVESFFIELAAQLKIHPGLAQVGKDLQDYGEAFSGLVWLPLVGPWIERGRGVVNIVSKMLQRRKEGIGGRRAKLRAALANLRKPIVVVLDDIDRLSTREIQDVFKLVRLTASFPNIIYILAFDRSRIEKALAEEGVPGRDYLEKILQVAVDLPSIPDHVLNRQIFSAIDATLSTIEKPGPFDEEVWPDVFMEIIRPLIRNMRDVRRFAGAIYGTLAVLKGEIALADVLALEAIRVFLPDVFGRFHRAVDGLTATSGFSSGHRDEPPHLKEQVDSLIEVAGGSAPVVRAMIERLFPAAVRHIGGSNYGTDWKSRWLRERRVAHEDILRLYLERVAGEGLQAFKDAEQAWLRMSDRFALDEYLRSLDVGRLRDVIATLEIYEDQFGQEHVVPGTIVLLNLLPELPERKGGMFELGTRLVVSRVTYRLVRSLKDPAAVESAVRVILPEVRSLSAKLELIRDIGYREGSGHKLVSEEAAKEFEKNWREELRARSVEELAKEKDLVWLFIVAKREAEPGEAALVLGGSPELTLSVLRSARSEVRTQSIGSRAVRRSPRLAWDALIELYGDEGLLRERIDHIEAGDKGDAKDLVELARKYIVGWRPKEFGED